jgi:hypothetical protein
MTPPNNQCDARRCRFVTPILLDIGELRAHPSSETMTIRTTRTTVTFRQPFLLKGAERRMPAGDYDVVTDEELIDGLSFLAYRRVLTAIYLPAMGHGSSIEMVVIDPQDLDAAQDSDRKAAIP